MWVKTNIPTGQGRLHTGEGFGGLGRQNYQRTELVNIDTSWRIYINGNQLLGQPVGNHTPVVLFQSPELDWDGSPLTSEHKDYDCGRAYDYVLWCLKGAVNDGLWVDPIDRRPHVFCDLSHTNRGAPNYPFSVKMLPSGGVNTEQDINGWVLFTNTVGGQRIVYVYTSHGKIEAEVTTFVIDGTELETGQHITVTGTPVGLEHMPLPLDPDDPWTWENCTIVRRTV